MGVKFTGDWDKAAKAVGVSKEQMEAKLKIAIMQEAHFFAGKIKEYISTPSNFAPLSPFTLKLRKLRGFGGEKPLNASGALKGAITVVPSTPSLQHFVGVLRQARSKTGQSVANIGRIMEEGATIVLRMTPKMRRFLFGVLFKDEPKRIGPSQGVKTSIIVIKIPARPFVRPTFDKWGPTSGERVYERLSKLFGGMLGKP